MSGPSRRIRITTPAQVTPGGPLFVTRRQDNRLYLRGEVFWNSNVYAYGDLLNILRSNGFGVAADTAEGHGQAVSMMQLVGMAENHIDAIHAHGEAEFVSNTLAINYDYASVKMELSRSLFSSVTPELADTVEARGQLNAEVQLLAMPTSWEQVLAAGNVVGIVEGHIFSNTADAVETAGHVRWYLVAGLEPGSQECLHVLFNSVNESTGFILANTQDVYREWLKTEVEATMNCTAIARSRYTVTFMNGDDVVYTNTAFEGDACIDPVLNGTIVAATKEPTVSHTFAQCGWARTEGGDVEPDILANITEDLILYPAFEATIRCYDIEFYDGPVLNNVISVPYGETPKYTPTKDGYEFVTWVPELVPVAGPAAYKAQWDEVIILYSGKCGDNATWTINDRGKLKISGIGAMYNYNASTLPWKDYRSTGEITSVVVDEGITHIGNYAMYYCEQAASIELPDTLESIGSRAIYRCSALTELTIPGKIVTLSGNSVYAATPVAITIDCERIDMPYNQYGCLYPGSGSKIYFRDAKQYFESSWDVDSIGRANIYKLVHIAGIQGVPNVIPSDVRFIGNYAMYGTSFESVHIPEHVTTIGMNSFYSCAKLTSVTFDNPDGWVNANGEPCDFSDPAANAKLLTGHNGSKTTYTRL